MQITGLNPIPVVPQPAMQAIVAARVGQPIDFAPAPTPVRSATEPASLQLYTRAADTVEAATGVHLGRSLDVRG